MKRLLISAAIITLARMSAHACLGCSRLDILEATMTDVARGGRATISAYDEGTFQGKISSVNFTGSGVGVTVVGGTATINIPGGAGSDGIFSAISVSSTALLATSQGNVGIGMNNPGQKLEVSGGSIAVQTGGKYLIKTNDATHGLGYYNTDWTGGDTVDGPVLFGWAGGRLGTMATGNQSVLAWTSGGNVGIGTPTPTAKLQVVGSITATSFVGNVTATGTACMNLVISTVGADTNQFVVTADAVNIMSDYYTAISSVVDISKTGAGGRDGTITDGPSMSMSIFLISNGSNYGVMFSSDVAKQPLLPTGYTKWRKIAIVGNDSSSNIIPIYKKDRVATFWTPTVFVFTSDLTSAKSVADFSFYVPSISALRLNANVQWGTPGITGTSYANVYPLGQNRESANDYFGSAATPNLSASTLAFVNRWFPVLASGPKLVYYEGANVSDFSIILLGYEEALP